MRATRAVVALLLLAPALSGCLTGEPTAGTDTDRGVDWAAIETTPHAELAFQVVSRTGGVVDVAGYAWWPDRAADTVVLAVHGVGGNALRVWGTADNVPGYSLGHRVQATGRALIAIDLPGYGNSGGVGEAATFDDYVHVTAQVTDHLRAGSYEAGGSPPRAFPVVVGLGWSMGGLLVVQAAGHLASFDAVVPGGWSDAGFSEEARGCIVPPQRCPPTEEILFEPERTDPRIVQHFENNTEEGSLTLLPQALAWTPATQEAPSPQDVATERVDVPVLWLLGDEDFFNQATTQADAERSFRASDDVTFVLLENTRHALFHHLNHEDVYGTLLAWLQDRGW